MKRAKLIADSGGTKTDWVLIDEFNNCHYFTTDSYHPMYLSPEWIEEKRLFWIEYTQKYDLEVHFFGAGCLKKENQLKMLAAFEQWGMSKVSVKSDILAAYLAISDQENGFVAIVGTGSVIGKIENREVSEIYGGLGYLKGDEGSGYYFGKLIIEKILAGHFSEQTDKQLIEILGAKEILKEKIGENPDKSFVAGISFLLKDMQNEEIIEVHRENTRTFIDLYLPKTEENRTIGIVGSYGFYQGHLYTDIFQKQGWKVVKIVEKPIRELAKCFMKNAL
jgi:glucosamine kinase